MKSTIAITLATTMLLAAHGDAGAVGTRRFVLDSLSTLEGGDLTGVAVTSNGEVRAGWTLAKTEITDASSVWAALVLGDGRVLLGTGTGGRVYQVNKGKVSIAAETGAMAVSALALGPGGDVFAGSFPEGKIFRIRQADLGKTEPLKPWVELKETEDIWSLAYDDKGKALFAATGPQGKLFRIGDTGNAEVHFDSEEPHLVSVALSADGSVYTGSNGAALLYKLTGPGRSQVIRDFSGDDVKAIAIDKSGTLYAIANEYRDSYKGLRPKPGAGLNQGSPSSPPSTRPGKGELWRIDARGVAELMTSNDDAHYVSLALGETGTPFVGSGDGGKVYSVDGNHVVRLVADTEERQIGAIVPVGNTRFIATSDPVVFHSISGTGGADAMWTSKVLDAGLRAHFGLIEWKADGTLEVMTRSGNTEKPDNSWSAWSRAMAKPEKVPSPPARYLQIRARFGRDPGAVLREVEVSFLTDNARALVTEITAGTSRSDTGGDKVPESGAAPDDASAKVELSWKIENPDNDKLRYKVSYKPVGGAQWFNMLAADEELTKTSYTWDISGLPEGLYRVRVEGSDELSNPPDRVTRHSLESRTLIVDNTSPRLSKLGLAGNRLQGTVTDGVGPIARIEFQVVGDKSWFPLFPNDNVFDQATESFDVDVSGYLPTGPHLLVIRAYDSAGNRITGTLSRR